MPDVMGLSGGYQLPAPSARKAKPPAPRKPEAKKQAVRVHKATTASASPPAHGTKKPSGHQFTKARRARTAAEQARHAARLAAAGAVALTLEPCTNLMQAHLYELQRILDLQHLILTDPAIPNEDKARHLTAFAQAMAKLRMEAELEKKIELLEAERAVESDKLEAERRKVGIEQRKNEADRIQLDAAWAKLNEERARLAEALPQAA